MVFRHEREIVPTQNVFHQTTSLTNTVDRSKKIPNQNLVQKLELRFKTSSLYIFKPNDESLPRGPSRTYVTYGMS